MTAAEPRQRHPAAWPQTETADRLIRVGRAGRQMPAIEPDQCRNAMAVNLDQPTRGKRRAAGKAAQKRAHASSHAHCRFHRATNSPTPSLYPRQVMAAAMTSCRLRQDWAVWGTFWD